MQDSGYRTGLVGKYLNNTEKHYIPPGWDEWDGMIGMASDHLVNENGHLHQYSHETLMTDVYTEKSLDFLRRATDDASDPPFMLWAGTFAPHLPADYAERDADLYKDTPLPKPPLFQRGRRLGQTGVDPRHAPAEVQARSKRSRSSTATGCARSGTWTRWSATS